MNLNKNLLRKEKGITLIALVITIIVLLLLAGVAISMLSGENGVINKANSANTENEKASTEEQVKIAVMTALMEGYGKIEGDAALGTLNEELGKIGFDRGTAGDDGKYPNDITSLPTDITVGGIDFHIDANGNVSEPVTIEGLINNPGKTVTAKTTLSDEYGDEIIIPKGFGLASNSAKIVDEGMVVVAPDGSEFVWIPVDDINSMVMCQSHTGSSDCNIIPGDDGKLKCENHEDTLICGKLYANGRMSVDNTFNPNYKNQIFYDGDEYADNYREPTIAGEYDEKTEKLSEVGIEGEDKATIFLNWGKQLQSEYEKMALSVYNNKGFYVGRYETTIDEKAQSKGEQELPSVGYDWYNLYDKQRKYCNDNNMTSELESTMIWGSQYDQIMLWLNNNSINVKNHSTSNKNKTNITGGQTNKDVFNNIYDLMGCSNEWTLERNLDTRTVRGGSYDQYYGSGIISERSREGFGNRARRTSSRITLYIK